MSLHRNLNRISIGGINYPKIVSDFIREVNIGIEQGFEEFELDFTRCNVAFPNATVPLAGVIDYFRNNNIIFDIESMTSIVESTHLLDPIKIKVESDLSHINVLNKVFSFENSDHVFWLVNAMLDELNKSDQFETGVLEGLEWCLNEVMDNVIQHSNTSYGYVMGQIHKTSKHVAFTIFDSGQGIYNSLKNSPHNPRHPIDALTLCIKEGITRDKKIGQGNGMYGLSRIVEFNEGRLTLTSNSASYRLYGDRADTFSGLPYISRETGCTTVDFQLDYNREVSISEALNFNGRSYELVNVKIQELENDNGEIVFKIAEKSSGFGTRQAGERVRNHLLNIFQQSNQPILLDFSGVGLISSSFADELIGKLVVEFGFFGFNNLIRMRNMNTLIQNIVQRSVAQRMAEALAG